MAVAWHDEEARSAHCLGVNRWLGSWLVPQRRDCHRHLFGHGWKMVGTRPLSGRYEASPQLGTTVLDYDGHFAIASHTPKPAIRSNDKPKLDTRFWWRADGQRLA